jgi:hypothetical protein
MHPCLFGSHCTAIVSGSPASNTQTEIATPKSTEKSPSIATPKSTEKSPSTPSKSAEETPKGQLISE